MATEHCHACEDGARDQAKRLILKTLSVRNVARWCSVSEAAVHQWLSRGSDERPIPPEYVPAIIAGADKEGIPLQPGDFWPAARGVLIADRPADEDHHRPRDFMQAGEAQ